MEFLLFVLHKPYLTLAAVLKECYGCKVKLVKSGNPYYRYFCNIHLACYRCYFFCMLLSLLTNPICVPDNTASNKEWKKKPTVLKFRPSIPPWEVDLVSSLIMEFWCSGQKHLHRIFFVIGSTLLFVIWIQSLRIQLWFGQTIKTATAVVSEKYLEYLGYYNMQNSSTKQTLVNRQRNKEILFYFNFYMNNFLLSHRKFKINGLVYFIANKSVASSPAIV